VTKRATLDQVKDLATTAARAASDKQGGDTIVLAVGELIGITDAFVVTSGANTRQVRTIADEVELRVKLAGGPAPLRVEGLDDARWVLMDFGDFVVHVFLDEVRNFYELARLWGDAQTWAWADTVALASGS
jgi:ribosome-associated protein